MFSLDNEGVPVSSHPCTSNFAEGYSAWCIRHDLDVILSLLREVEHLKIKWPGTSWRFKFCGCYDSGPSSCVRNTPTLASWQICEVPRTVSMLSMAEGLCCIARNAIETCDSIEGFDPAKPDDGLYRRVPSVYAAVLCSFCPNSFTKFPGICDETMQCVSCLAFLGRATVEVPVVGLNTSCIWNLPGWFVMCLAKRVCFLTKVAIDELLKVSKDKDKAWIKEILADLSGFLRLHLTIHSMSFNQPWEPLFMEFKGFTLDSSQETFWFWVNLWLHDWRWWKESRSHFHYCEAHVSKADAS